MSLSIVRRWTIVLAGLGLLGLVPMARGGEKANPASPLSLATGPVLSPPAATVPGPPPSVATGPVSPPPAATAPVVPALAATTAASPPTAATTPVSPTSGATATVSPPPAAAVPVKSPPAQTAPVSPPAPSIADPLAAQVDEAIRVNARRYLETDVQTPWQIIHGLLAYRREYVVKQNGHKVNALEWIASGPSFAGQPWFERTPYGAHAHPYNGHPYEFQGHPCQFLACMTMCDLPLDFKFRAGDGELASVNDLIHGAQAEVNDREEVTWVLWFLSHYLDSDAQWTNKDGEPWSMERLVQIELGKTVTSSACGGAHGLFALAYARNGFLTSGRTLYGPWLEADQKVRRHIEIARMYQNSDGTFSSNCFQGPGHSDRLEKRLGTTGHILEFLDVALPQSRLSEEWVRRAVACLADELSQNRLTPCECGALYHSIDGLTIYRTRVWPDLDPARHIQTTAKPLAVALPAASGSLATATGNSTPAPETPNERPGTPTEKASHEQPANGVAR